MESQIIEISSLTKKYGDYTAVDNLNLTLHKGEIFGLLGPNGAGKSTTILMLLGLTEPYSGQIRVLDIDPVRYPVEVKKLVGYLPEDVGFYESMSGLQNLVYTAQLNGMSAYDAFNAATEILEKVGLKSEMHKKTDKYSRGMRQRLGLADVLIKKPKVIILDEPTLGIDPAGIRSFLDLIVQLSREEGITVLFSSHHLHQVQKVCDRVGIFVKGKLLAQGNINTLANELFATTTFTIEAEISSGNIQSQEKLAKEICAQIKAIEGVENVEFSQSKIVIAANKDVTTEVAKLIVLSGAGLSSISKRTYGLDDIYHKYFEGGGKNE
ncbi:MAG: ABC transporter ATP-binding protein [Cyclobacteriaceae bacterium]